MTRWLCICQWGHSRSVALARVLHGRGEAAVAIGAGSSGDAIIPLSAWADRIALLEPGFKRYVPEEHWHKVVNFNVGPDRWSNPYNQELLAILSKMVDQGGSG